MDAELEFAIQPNTTGKQLFDQVRETSDWPVISVMCLFMFILFMTYFISSIYILYFTVN